jgi:hypothetical protein
LHLLDSGIDSKDLASEREFARLSAARFRPRTVKPVVDRDSSRASLAPFAEALAVFAGRVSEWLLVLLHNC